MQDTLVQHLSPSSIKQYFKSPAGWWNTYVARSPYVSTFTMEKGTAWHKGSEAFCRGSILATAKKHATMQMLEGFKRLPEEEQDREELARTLKKLEENLTIYYNEGKLWKVQKAQGYETVECSGYTTDVPEGALPMKGKMDALIEMDGGMLTLLGGAFGDSELPDFLPGTLYKGVIDHKYVSKNEGQAGEGGSLFFHAVQAYMYYHLYKALTGEPPSFFIIGQFKESKNRDGSSQYTEKVMFYSPRFLKKMDTFYKYLCEDLLSRKHFLPNPFQSYGAEDWKDFLTKDNELI